MVKEGLTDTAVQEEQTTGSVDLDWDTTVPTASLAGLESPWDPRLGVFPSPDTNPYLVFNLQSPNNSGALQNVKVRQALEYAIDKVALRQDLRRRVAEHAAEPDHPTGADRLPGVQSLPDAGQPG